MQEEIAFGTWLRKQRRALDLTRQAFADQVGCAEVTLRRIEAGTLKPSKGLANLLLEKIGIPRAERPQWISFARGLSGFPLPSSPSSNKLITNLPTPITTFIGREKEQTEIIHLIAKNRLFTLVGTGGIGKSRLAVQIGFALLNYFPTGTWLVELAPLSDPALMPQVIITTLGLIEQANRPPQTILTDFLKEKKSLLILDNCEHLIQACAQLAETLLHACPNLHILVTSREVLGISGEITYLVPSLTTPDPSHSTLNSLTQYEAVQLFLDRAQSAMRDYALTENNAHALVQVCHHLDGIPLAIELAAARVKLLRVEEIAARLDDRFRLLTDGARTALPRHQTLQSMINWSYDLLSQPGRVLLRRLSVFAGRWTLEAAEVVCAVDGIAKHEILDLLAQLVNKSLILAKREQGQETRYRMLETIRQYAHEKRWAAGEGELLRQRHLAYLVDLAEHAEPNLRAFDMVMWLDRLETELDNIRVALEYALESDVEAQLRLASALLWFWHIRGHKNEGVDWLERGLSIEAAERGDQPLTPDQAMIRGKALNVTGILLSILGNFEKTRTRSEQALVLFQGLGSRGRVGMAYALLYLADAAVYLENPRRVKILAEESLTLFQEVGDKFGMAQCLDILGWVISAEGDSNQVKAIWEENLALRKEIGDRDGIARVLARLGEWALSQGDLHRSVSLYEESLAIFREVGNEWARSFTLSYLALVFQAQGDYQKATQLLEEGLALARDLGDKYRASKLLDGLGTAARSQGEYERATQMYAEALILARDVGEPPAIAESLQALGELALAHGDYQQATQQFETELSIGQEKKIDWINAQALSELGRVAWAQGDFVLASIRFEKALTISREVEAKNIVCVALCGVGRVLQSQKNYPSACAHYLEALAIARGLGFREGIVSNLEALATLSVAQSDAEHSLLQVEYLRRATYLFGAAETLYPALRFEMSAKERAEHDQAIATARDPLGEEAFAAAWEAGKKMTLDEAVTYALEEI